MSIILAMAAMVVENRDGGKWSSWCRCIFVFALRPAIFPLLFLFCHVRRIDSGDDCDGRGGRGGRDRWRGRRSEVLIMVLVVPVLSGSPVLRCWWCCWLLAAKSPVVTDGQRPWIRDLEPCSSHCRN